MAIYIKDVDIPTNCTDCRYRPLVGCNPYQDNGLSPSDHRHRTCPLMEVSEPTGDLISRADAIEAFPKITLADIGFATKAEYRAEAIENIKALPSAEAVQGWIPCSERLPECGFGLHYLITLKDGHVFRDDVYEAFFDKYGWHVGDNELACDDIIAWMPLPEPYREDGEV